MNRQSPGISIFPQVLHKKRASSCRQLYSFSPMAKFSLIYLALLAFLFQPHTFHRASATTVQSSVVKRDILDFWASQNNLQYMANIFAQDSYSLPPGTSQAQHSTGIPFTCTVNRERHQVTRLIHPQLRLRYESVHFAARRLTFPKSVIPPGTYSPKLASADAESLNTLFIGSTGTVLNHLNTLLYGKAFFEAVNGTPQMRCHWVGDLARENDIFLSGIAAAAPSSDLSAAWAKLRTTAASGYGDFLGNVNGFSCGGL
ncbi:hypothetical protein K438DRAFT_2063928 [Mycena galopus ATCC 62051]|nr:hypothetical protein K438DRAFT_2063928 [Mycena galopus ATCC 62051]